MEVILNYPGDMVCDTLRLVDAAGFGLNLRLNIEVWGYEKSWKFKIDVRFNLWFFPFLKYIKYLIEKSLCTIHSYEIFTFRIFVGNIHFEHLRNYIDHFDHKFCMNLTNKSKKYKYRFCRTKKSYLRFFLRNRKVLCLCGAILTRWQGSPFH